MGRIDLFNFRWINILATTDVHIFLPINNVETAVFVHLGEIPGVEPPILYGFLCQFRAVPITPHQDRTTSDDLTDLAHPDVSAQGIDQPNLAVRDRFADGSCLIHRIFFRRPE